ncbi:MAG: type II toxin-antitoxin system RelE/ParE family toxin [Defluviitaleaceae bacterium]|nr:type II toxin-antitoxin system RelE/ParE family toxin [Defluviitaleaceae bacterium]
MKYDIEYLPSADHDLEYMGNVLAEYPRMLARIFREMEDKLQLLREHPRMYPIYAHRRKYRKMVLEEYLLFYTIDDNRQMITVCRVLYGKMNMNRQL